MSNYTDATKARLWEDGDGFRAPVGTPLPEDIFADTLTGWDAFGGIKAGFSVAHNQEGNDKLNIWNDKSGAAYRQKKGTVSPTIAIRPVDYSKATVATVLRGGTVSEIGEDSNVFELVEGDGEDFALILRLYDGTANKAYYVARANLDTRPEETLNDEDIEGWDLVIAPLSPGDGTKAIRRFLNWNPLALTP